MKKFSQRIFEEENLNILPSLNLNDCIYVKLSKEGETFFKKSYLESCMQAKISLVNAKEMLERIHVGEFWKLQFWEFIDNFAEFSRHTGKNNIDNFVESMEVILSKITERGEKTAKNTGIV